MDLTFTYAILFNVIVTVEQEDGDDLPGKDDDGYGVPKQAKQTNTVQQNTCSRIVVKMYFTIHLGAKNSSG